MPIVPAIAPSIFIIESLLLLSTVGSAIAFSLKESCSSFKKLVPQLNQS